MLQALLAFLVLPAALASGQLPDPVPNAYGGLTYPGAFRANQKKSFLTKEFLAERLDFKWVKAFKREQEHFPKELAWIRGISTVQPNSRHVFLRSRESVDKINSLISQGVEVFYNPRLANDYEAVVLGRGAADSWHSAFSKAIGKAQNPKPVLIFTKQMTLDVLVHEAKHAEDFMGKRQGALDAFSQEISALKVNRGLGDWMSEAIVSAVVESSAYGAQHEFLSSAKIYSDTSRMEASVEGEDLVLIPAPAYRELRLKTFFRSQGLDLMRLNGGLENLGKTDPELMRVLCGQLRLSFLESKLYALKGTFPACHAP